MSSLIPIMVIQRVRLYMVIKMLTSLNTLSLPFIRVYVNSHWRFRIPNWCSIEQALPKSRMGQAVAYTYTLWPRMRNYLKDGRLKIDNNLAENAIRPIALSRKNFLFCGNHEPAENTVVICSLLASCKASQVNPREWLTDIIAWLPYCTRDREKT